MPYKVLQMGTYERDLHSGTRKSHMVQSREYGGCFKIYIHTFGQLCPQFNYWRYYVPLYSTHSYNKVHNEQFLTFIILKNTNWMYLLLF
jgi:hypothetical protein